MRRRKMDSLGLYQTLSFGTLFYAVVGASSMPEGTGNVYGQNTALPFRPIGSESAVDRFQSNNPARENPLTRENTRPRETGFYNAPPHRTDNGGLIRQVAMQSGGFSLPPADSMLPGSSMPPTNPNSGMPMGPTTSAPPPRSLPNASPPIADYQPVAPPQLSNGGFSTMSDCRLITPASSYSAMSPYGDACGSGVAPTGYASPYLPPPAQIPAPAAMPTYVAPQATAATAPAAPVGSLVTFGQENYPVQVGQGLWGQPVAYVPGQRFRNWLRYLSF